MKIFTSLLMKTLTGLLMKTFTRLLIKTFTILLMKTITDLKLKGKKMFVPMENKTINVTITDTVFLDKENKRLNA